MRTLLLLIVLCAATASAARAADPPTFTKDIAPILFDHCVACHRPGEIGPFSLLTYRDARQHLTPIGDATKRRVMPPWKAARGPHAFVGDRSLTDAQIARIAEWASTGAREGSSRDLPPPPAAVDDWQLGTPDLVVTMEAPFTLGSGGRDVFRTFVLPIPTDRVRYVRGMEFHPGNARAVHHANIGVDRTKSSRRLDAADAEPG
jgi:mono/diheme cytochrome c family protein